MIKIICAVLLFFVQLGSSAASDVSFSPVRVDASQVNMSSSAADISRELGRPDLTVRDRYYLADLLYKKNPTPENKKSLESYQEMLQPSPKPSLAQPPKPKGDGMPTGFYKNTCSKCQMFGRILSCYCLSDIGLKNQTSLDINQCASKASVVNMNGALACSP